MKRRDVNICVYCRAIVRIEDREAHERWHKRQTVNIDTITLNSTYGKSKYPTNCSSWLRVREDTTGVVTLELQCQAPIGTDGTHYGSHYAVTPQTNRHHAWDK